jgi:hypothetical protein
LLLAGVCFDPLPFALMESADRQPKSSHGGRNYIVKSRSQRDAVD